MICTEQEARALGQKYAEKFLEDIRNGQAKWKIKRPGLFKKLLTILTGGKK